MIAEAVPEASEVFLCRFDHSPPLSKRRIARVLGYRNEIPEYVAEAIDTVVLACTHFPLLQDELQEAAGPGVTLIDGAAGIARRIAHLNWSTCETLQAHARLTLR